MKTLKFVPDGEFKVVHLNNKLKCLTRVGVDLPVGVKRELIECLRVNYDIFAIPLP